MNEATQLTLFNVSEFKPKPTLQSILECLDSIPRINEGGCGLAALAIYRWCKKNGIEVDNEPFVILCDDVWELSHNNACLEVEDFNAVSIPHIAIQIGDKLWDSTGSAVADRYEGGYTIPFGEDGLLTLLNEGNWNDIFKREHYLPIIALGVDVDLSDVRPTPW